MPISEEKIARYLARLADRVPAPAGGAAAALHVAQGAALLGMVARYGSSVPAAGQEPAIGRFVAEADQLREIGIQLAEADEEAFAGVAEAYRLPASTEPEREARTAALAAALISACWAPAQVISVAGIVVDMAEALAVAGNRSLLADVAAAAEAARAAAATARVSIEVNLAAIRDEEASLELIARTGKAADVITRAERVSDGIRERIRG